MKKSFFIILISVIVFTDCKKKDTKNDTISNTEESIVSDNTIVVESNTTTSGLIAIDSTKLTFATNSPLVDKIKIGSILVGDISKIAEYGFLRKVTAITSVGNNKIYITEQATLTDAIVKCNVKYNKVFSDIDIINEDSTGIDISAQQRIQSSSFTFNYNEILYDADGNKSTTYDQIKLAGEMKIEPSFDFELNMDISSVKKFVAKINLKNTNNIKAESKVILSSFNKEIVLKTFQLAPFTIDIGGIPVPIAKQWIAIVLGVDGNLSAKVIAGAQNINTAVAGISYENGTWNTINTQDNSFSLLPLTFEGASKVEPWLQVRYEIRPYGIKESRIYIGVRGSVIGEATLLPAGISTTLKWGIKFSAKAQMQIWDKAILNYEKVFYENEFPISQLNTSAIPILTTINASNVGQITAQSGGLITSEGGSSITVKGMCWSTSPNPTTSNSISTNGVGIGSFTNLLTGLTPNTTYFIRAYATNGVGTGYGNQINFTTQQLGGAGTVTDIDGNIYNTVIIGTQVWMKENLKTTRYRNGDLIPLGSGLNTASWQSATTGYYVYPGNNVNNTNIYGNLYNSFAVNDTRYIAPIGWHVPTPSEWMILINYLGGVNNAGGALKENGFTHWLSPNTGATNSSGFTGLPAGSRDFNGSYGFGTGFGGWKSFSVSPNNFRLYLQSNNSSAVINADGFMQDALSVRCIHD